MLLLGPPPFPVKDIARMQWRGFCECFLDVAREAEELIVASDLFSLAGIRLVSIRPSPLVFSKMDSPFASLGQPAPSFFYFLRCAAYPHFLPDQLLCFLGFLSLARASPL